MTLLHNSTHSEFAKKALPYDFKSKLKSLL